MVYFLISAAIVLLFFGLGKLLSKSNKHIAKKHIKGHERASDRMVNNYWGNMLSMAGFMLVCIVLFTPRSIVSFGAVAAAVCVGYVFHICDATGCSADDAISIIFQAKNETALQYFKGTMYFVCSVLITGIIATTVIEPIIFKEETTVQEEDMPWMEQTNSEKESQFLEDIQDYFQ